MSGSVRYLRFPKVCLIIIAIVEELYSARNDYIHIGSELYIAIVKCAISVRTYTRPHRTREIFYYYYLPSSNRITHSAESAVTNAGSWQQYTKYP